MVLLHELKCFGVVSSCTIRGQFQRYHSSVLHEYHYMTKRLLLDSKQVMRNYSWIFYLDCTPVLHGAGEAIQSRQIILL